MKTIECTLLALLSILPWAGRAGGQTSPESSLTLEALRQRVARNESLIDPIKLSYTVTFSRTGESRPAASVRGPGRRFSHCQGVWAQSGARQYVQLDYFYGPNEPALSSMAILDGTTTTTVKPPDRRECTVMAMSQTDWSDVFASKLGLRPFEDRWRLSELLVPPYAVLRSDIETIGGRPTRIVDLTAPDPYSGCVRVWIDPETGLPLRTCSYSEHPTAPQAMAIREVNDIKPYRLPNGGWIPSRGLRAIHVRHASPPFSSYEHIAVDVNSIVTHVPDSWFQADLPDGAVTYNDISGLVTTKGRPAKTYEQIVQGKGRFIAGTVLDEKGAPVAGVVAARAAVETVQNDGRPGSKLSRPHERICAITDARGRFALEVEPGEQGKHYLVFCHADFVDEWISGVAPEQHDLQVRLRRGGTLAGRAFCAAPGTKMPLAGVEVRVQGGASTFLEGTRRSRTITTTDAQGRFEFRGLPMQRRDRSLPRSAPPQYVPQTWQVRCGVAMQILDSITFESNGERREVELVLKRGLEMVPALTGLHLPALAGLGLNVDPAETQNFASLQGRRLLVCFFDMEQRPGRNCVVELARQATRLKERGVAVLAVHEKGIDVNKLKAWTAEAAAGLPVGIITGDPYEVKCAWAVRSLPWLILTDRNYIVTAEGFAVSELDAKLAAGGPSADLAQNGDKVIVTVTDGKGNALANVRVAEFETEEQYTTDGQGQFMCRPSDQARFFYAVDKERRLAQAERLAPGQRQLRMELLPARLVSGRVTDPKGRPLTGVQIAPLPMTSSYVLTDDEGQFDVGWLATWEPHSDQTGLCLMARHVERNLAGLVDISRAASRIDIQLTPALALSGKVTTPDGTPLPQATVGIWLQKWTWGCGIPVRGVTTDASGHFRFRALPQLQSYTLHVRAQGYETQNLSTGAISTIKDQEEVSPIVLAKKAPAEATKETGRLRLRVVDEEGKPVDIASVQIWKQRPEGGAHAETVLAVSTDTPGLCETEPIPIGRYQALSIQVEGWAPFRQADVEVRRGSSEVITCRLSRGGTIQGVVTDEKGRPVAGLPVVVNSILCRRDLTTDPDGRFEASHLPDTRYAVTVEPPPESPYATAILQGGASCGAKDVHLVVKRKTEARASLVGTNIWQAGQLTLPVEPSAGKGKMILLCLFDMGQRPSRNCLQQLGRRAPQLNERGVVVVAAQAAAADRTQLDHWIKENNIVLPIGMMRDDPGRTLVAWGVQSLPWLILTDSRHVVRAEGFSLDELEAKTQGEDEHEKP